MKSLLKWINIGLRGTMEVGVIFAFGYWGYHIMGNNAWKIVVTIVAPLIAFGIWGLVDFHRAGNLAEPLRFAQELFISGLAAVVLYVSGAHILGWGLGVLSVIHHSLTYLLGECLLKEKAH